MESSLSESYVLNRGSCGCFGVVCFGGVLMCVLGGEGSGGGLRAVFLCVVSLAFRILSRISSLASSRRSLRSFMISSASLSCIL